MRKLFLLATVLISQIAFAQKNDTTGLHLPLTDGKVVYQQIFKVPGKQQTQLYSNAQLWFVKRYKSDDAIDKRNHAEARVIGHGTETLSFKGPLKRDVPVKVKLNIEIASKADQYTVRISNIVYGYQAEPTEERSFFTAEDMINDITQHKYKNAEGINPVPFNNKQSKKALQELNPLIDDILKSINETMAKK